MRDQAATAPALQLAAQALHDSAADHKRLEQHHRRQARQKQRQIQKLRQQCAEAGIPLVLVITDIVPRRHQS